MACVNGLVLKPVLILDLIHSTVIFVWPKEIRRNLNGMKNGFALACVNGLVLKSVLVLDLIQLIFVWPKEIRGNLNGMNNGFALARLC